MQHRKKKKIINGQFIFFYILQLPHTVISNSEKLTHPKKQYRSMQRLSMSSIKTGDSAYPQHTTLHNTTHCNNITELCVDSAYPQYRVQQINSKGLSRRPQQINNTGLNKSILKGSQEELSKSTIQGSTNKY